MVVLRGSVEATDWSRKGNAGPAERCLAVVCSVTVSALQTGGKDSARSWLLIGRWRV